MNAIEIVAAILLVLGSVVVLATLIQFDRRYLPARPARRQQRPARVVPVPDRRAA